MTRDHALDRIGKLMALAALNSGASQEEARSAAVAAVRLMLAHGLTPGGERPGIDLDEVTRLAFRVLALERQLAAERTAQAAAMSERDEQWRRHLDRVRSEERRLAREAAKKTAGRRARRERLKHAENGGRARDEKLDAHRKSEIGRQGAAARWQRWRELHGTR